MEGKLAILWFDICTGFFVKIAKTEEDEETEWMLGQFLRIQRSNFKHQFWFYFKHKAHYETFYLIHILTLKLKR